MATKVLTLQKITQAGLEVTMEAAEENLQFVNNARIFLLVDNGSAAPITVTCSKQIESAPIGGLGTVTFADVSVAIPAGEARYIFFPQDVYSPSGRVTATLSDPTTVTAAAFELPLV